MQIGITGPFDDEGPSEDDLDPGEGLDLGWQDAASAEHCLTEGQPAAPDGGIDGRLNRLAELLEVLQREAPRLAAAAAGGYLTDDGTGHREIHGSYRLRTTIRPAQDVDLIVVLTPSDHPNSPRPPEDHRRRLIRLLKHWNQLATEPRPPIRFELAVLAGTVASSAVRAACVARDAVVHDPAAGREVVASFVAKWLGLRPTAAMVEAAANALLQAPLTPTDPAPDGVLIRRLRIDTLRQRRAWRPIGETQVRGRRVDSLDRPLHLVGDAAPMTVGDTVGAEDVRSDAVVGWDDQRIARVLARLRPDELRVVLTYVRADTITTWSAAARACGLPDNFGERVRCKLKRLGKDVVARIAAQGLPRAA